MPNSNASSQLSELTEQEQCEGYGRLKNLFFEIRISAYEPGNTERREAEIWSLLNEGVKPHNPHYDAEHIDIPCLGAAMVFIYPEEKAIQWMEILLQHGADINVLHDDKTLLHVAIEDNRLKIAEYLIDKHHLDINAKTLFSHTPLHKAAKHESNALALVRLLLNKGADPRIENRFGKKPKDETKNPQVIKLLLDVEKERNLFEGKSIEEKGTDFQHFMPNYHLFLPLTEQEQYEKYGQLQKLFFNAQSDIYVDKIKKRETKIWNLLNEGVKPHNPRWDIENSATPCLASAMLFIHPEKKAIQWMEILLKHGADIHVLDLDRDETLLHLAIKSNRLQVAEYLIDTHRLDINAKIPLDYTPLHMAAAHHSNALELVKLLLNKGADPRIKNRFGQKPKDETKDPQVINLLIEAEEKRNRPKQNLIEKENCTHNPDTKKENQNNQKVSSASIFQEKNVSKNHKNNFLKFLSVFKTLKSSGQKKMRDKETIDIKLKYKQH